ncbi:MAG: DUF3786 domain-containing protein [Desulfobacteraceae bacterium]
MQTAHNHMVLIVDDDEIVGKAVGHLVTHAGAAAVYVQSGTEALQRIKAAQKPFSLIILDQQMPGMKGSELLEQVKEIAPDTIRFLITGYADMDAAPLITCFTNEVEKALAEGFENNLPGLRRAGEALGGYRPNLDVTCDLALQFDALPRVPVVLLFNDVDDEFAPDCLLLFQRRTETFLDAECIAMLGRQLFVRFTGEGSGQHGH